MEQRDRHLKNWSESAHGYSNNINKEINSFKGKAWKELIFKNLPSRKYLKILDIGTGPGFFPIILSSDNVEIIGIDCAPEMLREAEKNAKIYGIKAEFLLSDTEDLPFEDNTFDVIINRNVAWTIIEAEKAYKEWHRVLKSGGHLLIFDANWNIRLFNEEKRLQWEKDNEEANRLFPEYVQNKIVTHPEDMEAFRKTLPMCSRIRPQWDLETLKRVGFNNITCQEDLGEMIYNEYEQIIYRSTPMFLLKGEK